MTGQTRTSVVSLRDYKTSRTRRAVVERPSGGPEHRSSGLPPFEAELVRMEREARRLIQMEIATWIRKHRKAIGLTQTELANAVGVHQSRISQWERFDESDGDRIDVISLYKIYEVCGFRLKITPKRLSAPRSPEARSRTTPAAPPTGRKKTSSK